MKICYSFPSKNRPDRFFDTLDVIKCYSDSDDYFVVAKLDNDDEFKAEYEKRLPEYPEVIVKWGDSKGKVDAVNRSLEDIPPFDIIIIQSDDIKWVVAGFDTEIKEAFKRHFPKLDGTVHFPEKHGGENTIIVSMLGVNLYKQLGHLYHPSYESVYCDNEFTEKTKMMKKYAFINKTLFLHLHPIWNAAAWDSLYRKNEAPEYYQKDRETYLKRKSNNFDL